MALYVVLKSGPAQGQTYELTDGLTIGRRGSGIRLNDPRVSSEHAEVVFTAPAQFQLKDLGSKNGIHLKGEKVSLLDLEAGLEFEIGDTRFAVYDTEGPSSVAEPKKAKKPRRKWNEILSGFLRKSLFQFENRPKEMTPLEPALVLDFLRGPQAETRWVLGYGPRRVGRLSLDLPIFERKASPTCFEIFSSPEGVLFKAIGPEVRLNGEKKSSEVLKVGDRIQILGTEIEVDFANEHD
jgi:pSer/pThr/pTyr-binding forkhead associated (FHA) protein